MFNISATYTDLYQLRMSQAYFKNNKHEQTAVFDYYFRKNPFEGGYTIFAGLEDLLQKLKTLKFTRDDLNFLKTQNFPEDFLNYLKEFRFHGKIFSVMEGDIVFPNRPILRVEATLIEAQLIETILLNLLNFQSLIATKACRMRWIAGNRALLDFGLRRAQGPGGYYASRAAFIGGFNGTSNVIAGENFNIPISGTMAHSFVQSYDNELEAFRDFALQLPKQCVLLVDTYNTLKYGVPNAITVAKEMEARGERLYAIRLDSGDLAYFAKESRKLLDAAGLEYVKIAASNQLDEYVIKSLQEQNAPIDIYGVGTNLVIGKPNGALDGVYKLAVSNGKPRIKISENLIKITLPHAKQVYRVTDKNGTWIGADVISLKTENHIETMHHPFDPFKQMHIGDLKQEPLLKEVMSNGEIKIKIRTVAEIAEYSRKRFEQLPLEYKRFYNPHQYKIGISSLLKKEQETLIKSHKN
ncbi:nicotinate phosphoribosyltransferase [Aureibaculum marinum]|uniref:Nicotinate phosphoribosyltransferase n=1 Tax=Aureibaculum marinum TaxID=2487930 RepID=A0A3N4NU53_9FLAO|nr:nicotinate phosphoribosyltransferase [Aureibaculum marinum]RPD99901.1 nicotinate phosphoribosyltransferase [Aureibaculum marinum]